MVKIPRVPLYVSQEMALKYGNRCSRSGVPEKYTPFWDEYTVTLNGTECPVRQCRVSAVPFNRWWPGKQRDISQSEEAGFISFSGDEAVTVRVKKRGGFGKAVLRPVSKQIRPVVDREEIVFVLKENGNYVLELDGEHHALHIFYNPMKEYPEAKDATYYFGPGLHYPGIISLKDNESVYVDQEAIVFGGINAVGASNIRVFGGGTIDNSCEERLIEHCYENFTKGTFKLYHCENVCVEDVILTNSSTWILALFYCDRVTIDGIKIVGHWRYNTDGIDICNTSNVLIKNSFVRSFDDVITIKGIYDYDRPIENIRAENCVLWCGWGHSCELGVETWAPEYRNIQFINCDVIRAAGPAMAIANGMHARIHDVRYEDIRVELQADTMAMAMQTSDEQKYEESKHRLTKFKLLSLTNYQYYIGHEVSGEETYCEVFGTIKDVTFKNIYVYIDDCDLRPIVQIASQAEPFENVVIEGLYLNGERQDSLEKFATEFSHPQCVILK